MLYNLQILVSLKSNLPVGVKHSFFQYLMNGLLFPINHLFMLAKDSYALLYLNHGVKKKVRGLSNQCLDWSMESIMYSNECFQLFKTKRMSFRHGIYESGYQILLQGYVIFGTRNYEDITPVLGISLTFSMVSLVICASIRFNIFIEENGNHNWPSQLLFNTTSMIFYAFCVSYRVLSFVLVLATFKALARKRRERWGIGLLTYLADFKKFWSWDQSLCLALPLEM